MDRDAFQDNSVKSQTGASLFSHQNLTAFITPKQRRRLIRKIFNGDKKDFEKFLALLSNLKTYKDASILLDFYFYKNEVDPMCKEALDIRNLVFYAYSPNNRKRRL